MTTALVAPKPISEFLWVIWEYPSIPLQITFSESGETTALS